MAVLINSWLKPYELPDDRGVVLPSERLPYFHELQAPEPGRVTLLLPVPPSVDHYWRHGRGKWGKRTNTYISADGLLYREAVRGCVHLQTRRLPGGWPWFPSDDLMLQVYWFRKNLGSGDVDNRLKALEDSLKGLLYTDDKQVARIEIERVDGPPIAGWPDGCVVVRVTRHIPTILPWRVFEQAG